MLDIDITFIYQVIGYFVLLFLLNQFLYKPVFKVLKERKEKTEGAVKRAAELDREVAEGVVAYERRLKEAAIKGNEERARVKIGAHDEEKRIIDAASAEASVSLASMKGEIEKDKKSALARLKTDAGAISREIAEKLIERKTAGIVLALAFTLLPALAIASSGGEEGHGGFFTAGMIWKIVNFVGVAVAVYLVWTKVVNKLLDQRGADIKKAIGEAQAAKDAAERKAAEYRAKTAALESRVAEITEDLRKEGEAERERILKDAAAAAERLKAQARLTAEQEVVKAKIELRAEAAALAVKMAEEILKKELKPEDQTRLVKKGLEGLRLN